MRGGSQKVTNDDEGEGGVTIPPKIDDVIYEQPLIISTNEPRCVGEGRGPVCHLDLNHYLN